jgi:hypothetical protein
MNDLRTAVRDVMNSMFFGGLPWSQKVGTAFGMALTWRLRPAGVKNLVLYGRPRKEETKELVAGLGISYVAKEIFVDFVVAEQVSETKMLPLVGCESEMHPNHGVGYSLDGANGYTFDFWKVLLFPAPLLVFAAYVSTAWLDDLEESLRLCARDYKDHWCRRKLYVVLLPSASLKLAEVRLAVGQPDGELLFEGLDGASRRPVVCRE